MCYCAGCDGNLLCCHTNPTMYTYALLHWLGSSKNVLLLLLLHLLLYKNSNYIKHLFIEKSTWERCTPGIWLPNSCSSCPRWLDSWILSMFCSICKWGPELPEEMTHWNYSWTYCFGFIEKKVYVIFWVANRLGGIFFLIFPLFSLLQLCLTCFKFAQSYYTVPVILLVPT